MYPVCGAVAEGQKLATCGGVKFILDAHMPPGKMGSGDEKENFAPSFIRAGPPLYLFAILSFISFLSPDPVSVTRARRRPRVKPQPPRIQASGELALQGT